MSFVMFARRQRALVRVCAVGLAILGARCETSDFAQAVERFDGYATRPAVKVAQLSDKENGEYALGSFDRAELVDVDLPNPANEPKFSPNMQYKIPFVFPQSADANAATSVELLCTNDRGATWRSYASVGAQDGKTAFLFEAPRPGEYWFALKTQFKNGKVALSSTKSYQFGDEVDSDTLDASLMEEPEIDAEEEQQTPTLENDFSLSNEYEEESEEAEPSMTTLSDADDSFAQLDASYIDNASYANDAEETAPSPAPTAPETDDAADSNANGSAQNATIPRPGKLKTLSFAKEEGTERLMVLARWFRPEDLEEQYRGTYSTLTIERAPSEDGPWTAVGKNLSVKETGYGWIATEDEMKPFYVRTVVSNKEGDSWIDVTPSPLDVTAKGVRAALGDVKTPVPFPPTAEEIAKKKPVDKNEKKARTKDDEPSLIRNTASQEETSEEKDEKLDENTKDIEEARQESKRFSAKPTPSETNRREYLENTARPERPIVPAPTNPNELEVNPLFTQGFGVLFRAAQTRHASDGPETRGKRSIFTKPSSARNATRPAERRLSPAQINARALAKRNEESRKRNQELAKYQKEHEMEMFEKKPELMEGRMFYMDKDGNLTTTPPPEFQQTIGFTGSFDDASLQGAVQFGGAQIGGEPVVDGGTMNANAAQEPIYMPQNTEDYDASARSGAATMTNSAYPNASSMGASPINNRYSDATGPIDPNGAQPIINGNVGAATIDGSYQPIPQTSFNIAPQGASYGATSGEYALPDYSTQLPAQTSFPPRPSVVR